MIARITGTIVDIQERSVIIDIGGLGYLVFTPFTTSQVGDIITLHTHMVIRDDAHELYGFATEQEKALFSLLISVSGVGPKTGLQMLTLYPLNDLVRSIKTGDSKAIALVPGIGKKTSEKVIIDLKDKLNGYETTEQGASNDLVEALLSLGYKDSQIRSVIGAIDTDTPLPKQIAAALQLLGK